MSSWEKLAIYCNNMYGSYIDWEERFFTCPECGEPLYDCDWSDEDFTSEDNSTYCCPICCFDFIQEEHKGWI